MQFMNNLFFRRTVNPGLQYFFCHFGNGDCIWCCNTNCMVTLKIMEIIFRVFPKLVLISCFMNQQFREVNNLEN